MRAFESKPGDKTMASGIYLITNTVNQKKYIGSSVNINRRWKQHRWALCMNRHRNAHLQAAWNKYGEQSFKFEILCLTDDLCRIEQVFLKTWKPEYNLAEDTTAPMRGRTHAPEACARIAVAKQGDRNPAKRPEVRAKLSAAKQGSKHPNFGKPAHNRGKPAHNRGVPISAETRAKLSAAKKGRPGRPHTEAHKKAISGEGNPFAGKRHSEETRAKMRLAWARRKANALNTEGEKR